ncbi:MAG: porin, partial [Planctomycetales bacterium]|nr:porin [Planctomycetales bacterium]
MACRAAPNVRWISSRRRWQAAIGLAVCLAAVGQVAAAEPDFFASEPPAAITYYPDQGPELGMLGSPPPASAFRTEAFDRDAAERLRNNFTALPDFDGGIVVIGDDAALKIGGFIKADFIADFDPIDATDSFVTTDIPIGAADRRNARFHARQSRLSFDTRWKVDDEIVRAFVEADFFGGGDGVNGTLRLRHAYGVIGRITAGQTWTTFTDPSAVPQTLDFEGAVSNVNRRQGQIRYTLPLRRDGVSWAVSLEDPTVSIEIPSASQGVGRTESPDLITHLRLDRSWGELQGAFLVRELGFQRPSQPVISDVAWGFNFAGSLKPTDELKIYSQITFGEG